MSCHSGPYHGWAEDTPGRGLVLTSIGWNFWIVRAAALDLAFQDHGATYLLRWRARSTMHNQMLTREAVARSVKRFA
jgi:hypothetical protein